MASEEAGQRTATSPDSPLAKRRNNLIQREVPLRADDCGESAANASPMAKYSLREASVRKSRLRESVAPTGSQN